MKTGFKIIPLIALAMLLFNCEPENKDIRKSNKKALLDKLNKVNSKGLLFGHQDDLAYGIGWTHKKNDELNSDVKIATGQFPAMFGWDVGHVGEPLNIDDVPFNTMTDLIIKADSMGGVNTISWHIKLNDSISSWHKEKGFLKTVLPGGVNHKDLVKKLDHLSDFLNTLKRSDGSLVPIIFRPWHEMSGNWFWWGQEFCTPEDFKELFVFTIDYLRNEKQLDNLLIAYAPDRQFHNNQEYLTWYPGDAYADILAFDNYYDFKEGGEGLDAIVKKIEVLLSVAKEKNKIAAFSETGSGTLTKTNWYTQELFKVLNNQNFLKELSYVHVWRNFDTTHFYVPHKTHPALKDFQDFVQNEEVLLLDDYNRELKK